MQTPLFDRFMKPSSLLYLGLAVTAVAAAVVLSGNRMDGDRYAGRSGASEQPDLAVASFSVEEDKDGNLTVGMSVVNVGGASGPFDVQLVGKKSDGSTVDLKSFSLAGVSGRGSTWLAGNLEKPADVVSVEARIDGDSAVAESDELNNTVARAITNKLVRE